MSAFTRTELDKLIEQQNDRIRAKVNLLRLKQVQRERLEAELICLKDEIEGLEKLVQALTKTRDDDADIEIMQGLNFKKRRTCGRRKPYDKLGCS